MTSNESADLAYDEATARIERAITRLRESLAAHQDARAKQPANWGFVGDAVHVATKLEEICEFIAGAR